MRIGILTFYKVANFGANLQALSTFYYLKSNVRNNYILKTKANHINCLILNDNIKKFKKMNLAY